VAGSIDGAHLATADYDGLVAVWDGAGQEVTSIARQQSTCLAWAAPFLASVSPAAPPCSPSATPHLGAGADH
jgi:hypothetical protein